MRPTLTWIVVAVATLAAFASIPARAWGIEGHIVVADIAEAHLTDAARAQVLTLLSLENHRTMAEVSSWADDVAKQRRETGSWHYVDIPLDAVAYDPTRDCKNDDCVVARIDAFTKVLEDSAATLQDQLDALKFVIHFVGDVHQPLHDIDNGDRGGNDVLVSNYPDNANLHRLWDIDMILADDPNANDLVKKLDTESKAEIAKIQTGSPADWANEGHAVGITAYAALGTPAPHQTIEVPKSYVKHEQPVMELQLERAGFRLAKVLNTVLR